MLGALVIALAVAASPPSSTKGKSKSKPAATKKAPAPAPAEATPEPAETAPTSATTPEKRDVQPVQKPKLGMQGMGRTPEEQKQLDELQEMLRSYEDESRDFKRDVQLLVEKKYEEKRSDLAASYEKAIRDLEVSERKERLDAIAQFEEFLQRYPDEPRYTPDVMFRLAELYYERSADDQAVAMRAYEDQLKRMDPSSNAAPPPEPAVDFRQSIALYRRLLEKFPKLQAQRRDHLPARLLPREAERLRGAPSRRTTTLIDDYPKSKFVTEAWVRIGEYYFDDYDDPDALAQAADAYEHAIKDTRTRSTTRRSTSWGGPTTAGPLRRRGAALPRAGGLLRGRSRPEEGRASPRRRPPRRGAPVHRDQLRRREVGLGRQGARRPSRRWAAAPTRPRSTAAWATSTSTRRGTPTPSPPTGWRCSATRWPTTRRKIQQKIVQAYERDRKLDEAFAESRGAGQRLRARARPGTRSTRTSPR